MPILNMTLVEVMNYVYSQVDPLAQAAAAKMGATCRKGCNHCCMLLATISVADGFYLADDILNRPDWKEWVSKLQEAAEKFCYVGLDKQNWFAQKRQCVFLKEGTCSVYERRPAACRYHYVVSPPEDCSPDAPREKGTQYLDMIEFEAKTSWEISMQTGSISTAPIPLMTLFCMEILARRKHADKMATVWKAIKDLPNPDQWLEKYGQNLNPEKEFAEYRESQRRAAEGVIQSKL